MVDFLENILAARDKDGGWIELLVPIVIVVIYAFSGLAKLKRGEIEKKLEKRPSHRDTEGKFRYKALDEAAASRPAAKERSVSPRAKTLPYAKEKAATGAGQQPAARGPVPAQQRQQYSLPPRPQPKAPPRPVRQTSYIRLQTPSPRPATFRPAQTPLQRPKPKSGTPVGPLKPKPAPKATQQLRKPQKVAAEEAKTVQKPRRSLRAELSGSSNLQRAIIYSEIVGKPLALRDM
ncbi:MAG TPA: hypothetical protein HPP87_09360 [Planctomycetes bacterium]|nr:hypothetical protein [Planctomycetota bacterium]HIJ71553.1 hypothetical protein [Planctomycetota bacterium]